MILSDTLDKISGRLFLLGFITTKLKNIPVFFLAMGLNILSLASYLIGYTIWTIATFFYPDHPQKHGHWYGFIPFKEQFKWAALLGTIASVICVLAPSLIIPTAWIYTLSNLLWSIGEYHKQQHPNPNDVLYSSVKQAHYLQFTTWVTVGSAFAASIATTLFLAPEAAFVLIPLSTIIGSMITVAALCFWGRCAFATYIPDKQMNRSYVTLANQLNIQPRDLAENDPLSNELRTLPPRLKPTRVNHSHPTIEQEASFHTELSGTTPC